MIIWINWFFQLGDFIFFTVIKKIFSLRYVRLIFASFLIIGWFGGILTIVHSIQDPFLLTTDGFQVVDPVEAGPIGGGGGAVLNGDEAADVVSLGGALESRSNPTDLTKQKLIKM